MKLLTTAAVCFALLVSTLPARSAPRPPSWRPPPSWLPGALCIHRHESVDWYRAGRDWQGRPSPYYGGMQFLPSTWRRAGGAGLPSDWPPLEQLYRAYVIWRLNRGSWREWGTAPVCGLR